MVRNICIEIEYDGTDYFGWQRQASRSTIQAALEDALASIEGRRVVLYGAGRTDSGAHAKAQVANFFSRAPIPPERWCFVLNSLVPSTIRVTRSEEVPTSFHAQKDAKGKIYEYRILHRPCASALNRRVYFYPRPLNWDRMRGVLPRFLGEQDFRSFQGSKSTVTSTIRKVVRFELDESRAAEGLYRFEIEGNGFLKQMVRTMIGTVIEVGEGKVRPEGIGDIFLSRNRSLAGRTVPAHGLCLVKVLY